MPRVILVGIAFALARVDDLSAPRYRLRSFVSPIVAEVEAAKSRGPRAAGGQDALSYLFDEHSASRNR